MLGLDLRQESKPAEVHAEQGNPFGSGEPRAGEERPVAAERDDEAAGLETVSLATAAADSWRIAVGFNCLDATIPQHADGAVDHRLLGARPAKNADDHVGAR